MMSVYEYQLKAMNTVNPDVLEYTEKGLSNMALGLCGESGEVADIIKKHLYQGHGLDTRQVARELGDIAWYLALGATLIGYDLDEIFEMNLEKLKKRYPNGFEVDRSVRREASDI